MRPPTPIQALGIHTHTHTLTPSSHLHWITTFICNYIICFVIIFRLHVHVHVPTATKIPPTYGQMVHLYLRVQWYMYLPRTYCLSFWSVASLVYSFLSYLALIHCSRQTLQPREENECYMYVWARVIVCVNKYYSIIPRLQSEGLGTRLNNKYMYEGIDRQEKNTKTWR